MIKKIVFCTLRDNKGATGGPGGVLFIQKEVLGKKLCNLDCDYWFNTYSKEKGWKTKLNKFCFLVKASFTKNVYFITHDIYSGRVLGFLRKPYSLIFHHQGPLVEEISKFNPKLTEKQIKKIKKTEYLAFTKANYVHFPSNGAADMYFMSHFASCKRDDVRIGKALFNVILQKTVTKPVTFEIKREENMLTFFSLGTLTTAKGQDQVVEFMKQFLPYYEGDVRYIIVGKGPLRDELDNGLKNVASNNTNFSYKIIESMPHDSVMYLHQISDVYIMMHRISIFDFATLEAMSQGSAIVLSKVGGNTDFNKEDNVIYAEDAMKDMSGFAATDFDALKKKNETVFKTYFSEDAYRKQYEQYVSDVIEKV